MNDIYVITSIALNTLFKLPYSTRHRSPGSRQHIKMSSIDVAHEIRSYLPETEDIIVDYLSGYLVDDASQDEDVIQVTRNMLESFARDRVDKLEELTKRLSQILEARINTGYRENGPRLLKLDKVLRMGKTGAMSNTIAFTEGVDLESINKSK